MGIQNSCQCDFPPGGGGSCSAHQMSICRTRGGACFHECRSPPAHITTQGELDAWSYTQVTAQPVFGPLSTAELGVLQSRRYFDSTTGDVVTFELPKLGSEGEGSGQTMMMS